MKDNRNLSVGMSDGVATRNGIGFGMKRDTTYNVEAYSPIVWGELERRMKEFLPKRWKEKMNALHFRAMRRDGEFVVPVHAILNSFRNMPVGLPNWLLGTPLWADQFHNLVTTAGLNDSLTEQFKASSYTAAWYVGLTQGSPTFSASDTSSLHSGWTESTAYSESVRQTLTLGSVAAGSVDNTASKAVFTINTTATVGGAFVITVSTKGGSTGVLYGGGAFGGGNRSLQSADTLTMGITLTAS